MNMDYVFWPQQLVGVNPRDLELNRMIPPVHPTSHLHLPQENSLNTTNFTVDLMPNSEVFQLNPLPTTFAEPYMDMQPDGADIFGHDNFKSNGEMELPIANESNNPFQIVTDYEKTSHQNIHHGLHAQHQLPPTSRNLTNPPVQQLHTEGYELFSKDSQVSVTQHFREDSGMDQEVTMSNSFPVSNAITTQLQKTRRSNRLSLRQLWTPSATMSSRRLNSRRRLSGRKKATSVPIFTHMVQGKQSATVSTNSQANTDSHDRTTELEVLKAHTIKIQESIALIQQAIKPFSLFSQLKAADLISHGTKLVEELKRLATDEERYGNLSSDSNKSNERSVKSLFSDSISSSELADTESVTDNTSISSARPGQSLVETQESVSTDDNQEEAGHLSCSQCDIKPLYYCTFDNCKPRYSTHSLAEYKRHGKCKKHSQQEGFMCLVCQPQPLVDINGHALCGFCHTSFPNMGVDLTAHYLQCRTAQQECATYVRKDKLLIHLRKFHSGITDPDQIAEVAAAGKYTVDSEWPRQCGFCGETFDTWDERMDHLAGHFERGLDMSDWKRPYSRSKDFHPRHNPHGKDDGDDSDDDMDGNSGRPIRKPVGKGNKSVTSTNSNQKKASGGSQSKSTSPGDNRQRHQRSQCILDSEEESAGNGGPSRSQKTSVALERYLNDTEEPILTRLKMKTTKALSTQNSNVKVSKIISSDNGSDQLDSLSSGPEIRTTNESSQWSTSQASSSPIAPSANISRPGGIFTWKFCNVSGSREKRRRERLGCLDDSLSIPGRDRLPKHLADLSVEFQVPTTHKLTEASSTSSFVNSNSPQNIGGKASLFFRPKLPFLSRKRSNVKPTGQATATELPDYPSTSQKTVSRPAIGSHTDAFDNGRLTTTAKQQSANCHYGRLDGSSKSFADLVYLRNSSSITKNKTSTLPLDATPSISIASLETDYDIPSLLMPGARTPAACFFNAVTEDFLTASIAKIGVHLAQDSIAEIAAQRFKHSFLHGPEPDIERKFAYAGHTVLFRELGHLWKTDADSQRLPPQAGTSYGRPFVYERPSSSDIFGIMKDIASQSGTDYDMSDSIVSHLEGPWQRKRYLSLEPLSRVEYQRVKVSILMDTLIYKDTNSISTTRRFFPAWGESTPVDANIFLFNDVQLLLQQLTLDIFKLSLARWADTVGALDENDPFSQIANQEGDKKLLIELIGNILLLFENARRHLEFYEDSLSRDLTDHFKYVHAWAVAKTNSYRKNTSLTKKTTWALFQKKHLEKLIALLAKDVDGEREMPQSVQRYGSLSHKVYNQKFDKFGRAIQVYPTAGSSYSYDTINISDIRLLSILPGLTNLSNVEGPPNGKISHDRPAYTVLSHTWVDVFRTSRSLIDVLNALQSPRADDRKYYWVDSICTDQGSSIDKRDHISRMSKLWRDGVYPCQYPGTYEGKRKLFGHLADLERHYKNVHPEGELLGMFLGEQPRLSRPRNAFIWRDHFRDHFRDRLRVYPWVDIGSAKRETSLDQKKWEATKNSWFAMYGISHRHLSKMHGKGAGFGCPICNEHTQPNHQSASFIATPTNTFETSTNFQVVGINKRLPTRGRKNGYPGTEGFDSVCGIGSDYHSGIQDIISQPRDLPCHQRHDKSMPALAHSDKDHQLYAAVHKWSCCECNESASTSHHHQAHVD